MRDIIFMKRYMPFFIVAAAALTALGSSSLLSPPTMQPHYLTISADEAVSAKSLIESVHIRGNAKAPVTLEEFGDFECPSCARLATFLDQLIKEYHPRVRLIFRNFPLAMHPGARDAALAAEAAGVQGHFWEMHDLLFKQQAMWSGRGNASALFESYAETLGLDLHQFTRDIESEKVRARIESDQARAKLLGVKTAPTLFVDKREMGINDSNPEGVRRLIDQAVKAKTSAPDKR